MLLLLGFAILNLLDISDALEHVGRIPFIVDNSLKSNPPQYYAFLSAKSELERQTCIQLYPKTYEYDYIHFTASDDSSTCWNIFEKPVGSMIVNVGSKCLPPFGSFNDDVEFQEPFNSCDIAYLNELYQCNPKQYLTGANEEECLERKSFRKKLKPVRTYSPRVTPRPKWPPKLPKLSKMPNFPQVTKSPLRPRPRPGVTPKRPKSNQPVLGTVIPGPCKSACTYFGTLSPLYRSFNEDFWVANHFYTDNRLEQSQMIAKGYMNLSNLGFIGQTPMDSACLCLKPLYRLHNDLSQDTLLTTEEEEKTRASTLLGYRYERIVGYCTSEPGCGAYLPLYRMYNAFARDHMYITQQSEMHSYKSQPNLGYGLERIECYIWEFSISARACEQ